MLPVIPAPPAGEVWQLRAFWSRGQQHRVADECVAKSHSSGWEVPWCGRWPRGWQAQQSRHMGSAHICSNPAALPVLREGGKGRGCSGSFPDPSLISILLATSFLAVAATQRPPSSQLSSTALPGTSMLKGQIYPRCPGRGLARGTLGMDLAHYPAC